MALHVFGPPFFFWSVVLLFFPCRPTAVSPLFCFVRFAVIVYLYLSLRGWGSTVLVGCFRVACSVYSLFLFFFMFSWYWKRVMALLGRARNTQPSDSSIYNFLFQFFSNGSSLFIQRGDGSIHAAYGDLQLSTTEVPRVECQCLGGLPGMISCLVYRSVLYCGYTC